nr:bifunctional 3-(3-hydroxy-phenyl)propionate/3-hydroxycinnamic acid hydroxylase [uncultured Rhodopila sp.]
MGGVVHRVDVAVIGCGPVGAMLANLLGLQGLRVAVLEREAAIRDLPRAVHFDAEIMRLLQTAGLVEAMLPVLDISPGTKFVDPGGRLLLEWPRPAAIGPQGWHAGYRFHQPDLEKVLCDGLSRWPGVTLRRQAEVISVERGADAVELLYKDLAGGEIQHINARFAVGCDGAQSLLRHVIGGAMEDLGFEERWLAADVILRRPPPDLGADSVRYCDGRRPAASISGTGDRRRWEIALLPEEDSESMTRPESVLRLLERWAAPEEIEVERAAVYTFRAAIASRWRLGKLLIAGDAAHLTPPFLGQGLCAGLRDVANLAWKLGRVLRGQDGASLLDTYHSEREPHVREYIEMAVRIGGLMKTSAPEPLLNGGGSARMDLIEPRLGPGLCGGLPEPRGRMAPQPMADGGIGLDDRIGYRFAAVMRGDVACRLSDDLWAMLRARDVAVVTDSAYGPWLDGIGAEAVLVRPDRYVFGAAHDANEMRALVAAL